MGEKPRLFNEHPLKNEVRRLQSLNGNEYVYSDHIPRRESQTAKSSKGVDLQLQIDVPKYYKGKKLSYLFFYPMEFPKSRVRLEKAMNTCKIPIPSDIRNGEIICIPQLGLKKKNSVSGDVYFKVKIISNMHYVVTSSLFIVLVILYLIIFVFVEFFIIESI